MGYIWEKSLTRVIKGVGILGSTELIWARAGRKLIIVSGPHISHGLGLVLSGFVQVWSIGRVIPFHGVGAKDSN